jgi:hypothetical protein
LRSIRTHITIISVSLKGLKKGCDGRPSINAVNPSLIIIPTIINDSPAHAIVDTGATHSLTTRSTLVRFPHPPVRKTPTTITVFSDASTTIVVYGSVPLCIYINRIPIYASVFVVDSLGADFILGMDWCDNNNVLFRVREQQLFVRHPRHEFTTVPFLHTVSVPVRLAQSIQLAPHHEHIVTLYAPLSSASSVSYTPDSVLCMKKQLVISEAILKINRFHTYMIIYNSASTPCTLRANTVLGNITFFPPFPATIKLTSLSSSKYSPPRGTSLLSLSSIQSSSTQITSDVDSVIQNLVRHIVDDQERREFLTILRQRPRAFDSSKHTIAKTQLSHGIVAGDDLTISVRPCHPTVEQRKELQTEVD